MKLFVRISSISIAIFLLASNATAQKVNSLDSLKALNFQTLTEDQQAKIFLNIAHYSSSPNEIIHYAEKAATLYLKKGRLRELAISYESLSYANKLLGGLDKALKYGYLSLRAYEEIGDKPGIAVIHNTIGTIYREGKNYDKAIDHLKISIEINKNLQDSLNLAGDFNNYGEIFRSKNDFDSALLFYQKAYLIYESINSELGIGYALGNIGLVYASQGKHNLAEENIRRATEMLTRLGDFYPVAVYHCSMADIFKNRGEVDIALNHAHSSLEIAKEEGLKEQIRDASLKLSELYNQKQSFEKAYHFQTQYIAYRDSINSEATIQQMADLRTEYEVAQKQAEVDLLTESKEKQQIFAISLAFIVVLIGTLAFVQFRNNRKSQVINRKLSEQKAILHQQHDQLEALNKTKDRFFSIISHDLRGPVNAFNGISSLIQHYISVNDMEQLVEVSSYIDKSASQLSALLDNLLNWAVNQQGHFPYIPEKIDFCSMMDEIVGIFRTAAHAKNINLTIDCEQELLLWADRNSLTTIVRNLVNNSLKFTEQDGSVTIAAYAQEKWGIIQVIDTGVGIPKEKLQSIFQLIEKKNSPGTAGEKGLGIGLQLAYDFSEMNKGSISVESEENIGTTFTVKIPLFNENKLVKASQVSMETHS